MKKPFYAIIILALAIAACSKKSSPKPVDTILKASGKYKLVQNSDTLYKNDNIANGVAEILNQNAGGDTSYLNPGTPQLKVTPNAIVGYNPVIAMTDTLNFITDSTGTERTSIGSHPFYYSLATHFYYSGIADGTITEKIYRPNATTVKLVVTQRDGSYIGSNRALIYIKD